MSTVCMYECECVCVWWLFFFSISVTLIFNFNVIRHAIQTNRGSTRTDTTHTTATTTKWFQQTRRPATRHQPDINEATENLRPPILRCQNGERP